jgi:hypothetical protein
MQQGNIVVPKATHWEKIQCYVADDTLPRSLHVRWLGPTNFFVLLTPVGNGWLAKELATNRPVKIYPDQWREFALTELQHGEMRRYLGSVLRSEDPEEEEMVTSHYLAGFEMARKPLALDRACANLDFLLKSGFFASKKR